MPAAIQQAFVLTDRILIETMMNVNMKISKRGFYAKFKLWQ